MLYLLQNISSNAILFFFALRIVNGTSHQQCTTAFRRCFPFVHLHMIVFCFHTDVRIFLLFLLLVVQTTAWPHEISGQVLNSHSIVSSSSTVRSCSPWGGDGLDIGGQHGRRFVLLSHTHRPQRKPYPICTSKSGNVRHCCGGG